MDEEENREMETCTTDRLCNLEKRYNFSDPSFPMTSSRGVAAFPPRGGMVSLTQGCCIYLGTPGSTWGDPAAVDPGQDPGSSLAGITALGISVGPYDFIVCGHWFRSFFC